MSALQRLRALAARLSSVGEFLSNLALLFMTLGITADVLARWLAGTASKAAVELTGYFMVAVVFLGLAPAQRVKAHIQIEVFVKLLPERIALDEHGFPVLPDRHVDDRLLPHARRAVAVCPSLALRLESPAPTRPVR